MNNIENYLDGIEYNTYDAPGDPVAPRSPQGYEPGVKWDGEVGTLTTRPVSATIDDWTDHLIEWGFDPAVHEVVEPFGYSAWEVKSADGGVEQLKAYRVKIRRRSDAAENINVEELVSFIKAKKAPKSTAKEGPDAMVVYLADWQLGKRDKGGTEGIVKRIGELENLVVQRVKELRKIGRPLGILYIMGMGDIVENCDGHYPMQTFTTDINLTEQEYIAQFLILSLIKAWAPLFTKVIVTAVPGNHGENRKNGKAFTSFDDNSDTKVFRNVAMACKESERMDNVSFVIPTKSLTVVLDVAKVKMALLHGHQAKSGATPALKMKNWMKNQAFAGTPEGAAQIYGSAHYHHFTASHDGKKTHFQCPAMEGGSDWFSSTHGVESPPGTLTVRIDSSTISGWDDLAVLR